MENGKEQLHYKDQRCHFFSYKGFTMCLVCKITISCSIDVEEHGNNNQTTEEHIVNHLKSFNHKKCMKSLFKMRIPRLIYGSSDKLYLDILTKSTFGISVLLEEGSSYICQKDDHLFCLMCQYSFSGLKFSIGQLMGEITYHLNSSMHSKSVKNMCWFYRFNLNKDFLLFHKSILHCSVCQEIFKCKKTELLLFAIRHLRSHNQKSGRKFKQSDSAMGSSINDKSFINSLNSSNSLATVEQKFNSNAIKSEESIENIGNVKCVENSQDLYEQKDIFDLVKTVLEEHKDNTIKCLDPPTNVTTLSDKALCNHFDFDNYDESVNSAKDKERKKHELMTALFKTKIHIIKGNRQFLRLYDKEIICMLCQKSLCSTDHEKNLFNILKTHFRGMPHQKILVKIEANKFRNRKCVHRYPMHSDLMVRSTKPGTLQWSLTDNSADFPIKAASSDTKSGENSNENQLIVTPTETYTCIKDVACRHNNSDKNKFLGKCSRCITKMLSSMCPAVQFYIQVRKNKCFCGPCGNPLSHGEDFSSLMISYLSHTETEIHEEKVLETKDVRTRRNMEKEKNDSNTVDSL